MFFFVSVVFVAYEELIQSEFEKEKEKGNMKKSHIMAWTGFSFFILGLCIEAYKIMFNRKPKVVNAGTGKNKGVLDTDTDTGVDAMTDAVTDEGEGEGVDKGEGVDEGVDKGV